MFAPPLNNRVCVGVYEKVWVRESWDDVGNVKKSQIKDHSLKVWFYSKSIGKLIESMGKERNWSDFLLLRSHSGCGLENKWQTSKSGNRKPVRTASRGPGEKRWWLELGCWQWRWENWADMTLIFETKLKGIICEWDVRNYLWTRCEEKKEILHWNKFHRKKKVD